MFLRASIVFYTKNVYYINFHAVLYGIMLGKRHNKTRKYGKRIELFCCFFFLFLIWLLCSIQILFGNSSAFHRPWMFTIIYHLWQHDISCINSLTSAACFCRLTINFSKERETDDKNKGRSKCKTHPYLLECQVSDGFYCNVRWGFFRASNAALAPTCRVYIRSNLLIYTRHVYRHIFTFDISICRTHTRCIKISVYFTVSPLSTWTINT